MELKVANEYVIALSDITNMACKIVVEEDSLCFVFWANFIVDEIALSQGVVMVESVHSFGLCVAIINIFLHIEAVHVDELGRVRFVKQLLLE